MNEVLPIQAPARAGYAEVLAAPDHMIAEVLDGALELQPRPASQHGQAADHLLWLIYGLFHRDGGGPGGWWIKAEPELHLGEGPQILVPDLAGWRRTTLPTYPRAPFVSVVPDWVCEIISPSTRTRDRGRKADIYAELGVRHMWIVDPDAETLEAFRLEAGKWLRLGCWAKDAQISAEPFDAVTLKLAEMWLPDS